MADFMVSLYENPCPLSLCSVPVFSSHFFFCLLHVFHFNSLILIIPPFLQFSFLMYTFISVSFVFSTFHCYLSSFRSWYFPLSVGFHYFLWHFLSFLSLIFIFNILFLSFFSLPSLFPNTHAVCSIPHSSSPRTTVPLRSSNPPAGCCSPVAILAACCLNSFQLQPAYCV